jgi:hypothetical protein
VQEQEQRQRELREKLAQAKIRNVRGLEENSDAIFGPVPDYVEKRRPITRLFFSIYDNLGVLMVVNFFTFLFTLPLLFVLLVINNVAAHHQAVSYLLPLLLLGLIAPPSWAAASSFCAKIVEEQMHPLSDYWADYRRFAGKGIVLAMVQLAAGAILIYSTGWYLGQPGPAKFVGIVSLYAFIFWALAGLYVWPLLVRGYSWRAILRNAGVLVIAAPLRSAGILFVLLVLSVIMGITVIGLVVLAFALWAMLPNQALVLTRERLERRTAT